MIPRTAVRSLDPCLGPTDVARPAQPSGDILCLSGRAIIPDGALTGAIPGEAGRAALSMDPTKGGGIFVGRRRIAEDEPPCRELTAQGFAPGKTTARLVDLLEDIAVGRRGT